MEFTHLHVHTQYSLLDGASAIPDLFKQAEKFEMKALAITDHGNMFGVKKFCDYAKKHNIKPIIGCEVYVARRTRHDKKDKIDSGGHHLILLAKNKEGYKNLVKLVSTAWIDGFYNRPRVDKELLRKFNTGLIASTACLGGEVPKKIMNESEDAAEQAILDFKEIYGEDFYLELQNHGVDEQKKVNEVLIRLSKKTNTKLIATNDVHFIKKEDADAHSILICLNTGQTLEEMSGVDASGRKKMHYTGQEYLKSPDEMAAIFRDVPEAIANTMEIADKVETFKLDRDVLLPKFELPEGFETQDDFMRHLTYVGAEKRYKPLTDEIRERLDYELKVIKDMGFAGYFLIVQDFINKAREMGVSVGPGRGSAAGSAVAYCIGITDIDPILYKLLFERFLNPERVSMPDIDVDFDEDGREKVLKYVVNKYGKERVAHIITFGSMAAKSSIKDVARVLEMPLDTANMLSKLVPEKPGTTLKMAYDEVPELKESRDKGDDLVRKTLAFAETLEGSVRQTGVHACGIIIGPEDLIEHIPLSTNKEAELLVTQYDGKFVEGVGMLKMDFLGLKTLSIIKDAIDNVKHSKGLEFTIYDIPMDDKKTYELYQRGETIGTFQFESEGMRMHLKDLKPNNIEDLIAMNALYRPGPMDFIPTYIKRKHGQEKTEYPHPMLEPLLKDTYGIMIYQEQIMQAAQVMGGYTLGGADLLRRAMGKKKADEMAKQKSVFVEGAMKKGVDQAKATEVFEVMEKFASYGFNRSHSAAYSVVAFYTGYLKANYPAEYMSAVLSRNLSDIKKITTFMDECKRMNITVGGPDVNESDLNFTVNKQGQIRFGLSAIKGVGEAAALDIIQARKDGGPFKSIFDFVERVTLRSVNKKNLEALALAGAFDEFKEVKRHQYFSAKDDEPGFIDALIRYGNNVQAAKNSNQNSLFGATTSTDYKKPDIPNLPEWSSLTLLNKEKELVGIYLSAHPLDDFRLEINSATNASLADLEDLNKLNGKEMKVAGIVTGMEHRTAKNGNPWGNLTIEDFMGSYKFTFFSKDYLEYKKYFTQGYALLVTGKVQPRYNGQELEFRVSKVQMLAEVRDKIMKSISVKVSLPDLSDQFILEMKAYAENNTGNSALRFLVFDPESKVWVQMTSRAHKINITPNLVSMLESNKMTYKID